MYVPSPEQSYLRITHSQTVRISFYHRAGGVRGWENAVLEDRRRRYTILPPKLPNNPNLSIHPGRQNHRRKHDPYAVGDIGVRPQAEWFVVECGHYARWRRERGVGWGDDGVSPTCHDWEVFELAVTVCEVFKEAKANMKRARSVRSRGTL